MKQLFALFLILFAGTLDANVVERYYYTNEGKASFISDAPYERVRASCGTVTGMIDPAKRTFTFRIPFNSFEGFNCNLQQRQFQEKFIETGKYPDAVFTGKLPYDFRELKKGMQELKIFGVLKIHGVQKERTLPVTLYVSDHVLIIRSVFSVPLEDHNIEIPKVMTDKIARQIKVEVAAIMKVKFGGADAALASVN